MTEAMEGKWNEVEELLPWYAAGTATPEETALVEAALARDPALRRSLDLIREDMDASIAANNALPVPSPRAFEKLAAGMEAHPRRVVVPSVGGMLGWLGDKLAALAPRQLAYAGIAAAVVLVAQAAVVGGLLLREQGGGATFQTASHGDQATAPATAGTTVLIGFAPAATAEDVTRFLQRHGATIVSGPAAGGVYRVRIDVTGTEAQTRIGAMRGETAVVRTLLPSR